MNPHLGVADDEWASLPKAVLSVRLGRLPSFGSEHVARRLNKLNCTAQGRLGPCVVQIGLVVPRALGRPSPSRQHKITVDHDRDSSAWKQEGRPTVLVPAN